MAYFSNGTEGAILDAQCASCVVQHDCPIELAHLEYNYEQVGNDLARAILELLVNKEGLCQMRPLINDNEEDT